PCFRLNIARSDAAMQGPVAVTGSGGGSSTKSVGQRFGEEIALIVTSDTGPDAAVQRLDARHAHENAARDESVEQAPGEGAVAAAIDGDEIRGRRQRLQALTPRHRADALARPA